MKLAEVKIVFEDMLSELEAGSSNNNTFSDSITKFSGRLKQTAEINGGSSTADQPTRSAAAVGDQSETKMMEIPRKASPELENPHIVRGIKGFVEFRRVVRGKGSKGRDSDAKLECQKSQLRVLLKHKGAVRSNNLIIT